MKSRWCHEDIFIPLIIFPLENSAFGTVRAKQGKVTKFIKIKNPKYTINLGRENLCLITYKKCKIHIQPPNKSNLMQEIHEKKNKHY